MLLAFSAGLIAALNPCGFALLPGYLSLVVLGTGAGGRSAAVGPALTTSAVMTTGFVVVFLGFGLAVAPVAASAQRHLPWLTLTLGVALAAAGVWLLAGRRLPAVSLGVRNRRSGTGPMPAFLYGVGYALASLTCTIAPFLAVVVSSFQTGSPSAGLLLFLAYALGMGALVAATAVMVALARSTWLRGLRSAGAHLSRGVGALLVLTGAYVAWYGAWELRVLAGNTGPDPVVNAAAQIRGSLVELVTQPGSAG